MNKSISVLYSKYVIDGVQQELTPAQILESVRGPFSGKAGQPEEAGRIVDESSGPGLSSGGTDASKIEEYLDKVISASRKASIIFPQEFTRGQIEKALLDCLWRMGNFRLGDLCLDAKWTWNEQSIGNMAALYSSFKATGEFLDALGLCLRSYSEEQGVCGVQFIAVLRPGVEEGSLVERPFSSENPRLGAASLPSTLHLDPKSWIVYIPFDTSSYRLGGSLLAQAIDIEPAVAPIINDPYYFHDCYEVVRKLVEDGIILSASTVSDGGLITALKGMTSQTVGAVIDLSDLRIATREEDPVRLLFSEVPGAIIQIRDIDFDYIDAELLLQDIAFYPLGHPAEGGEVQLHSSPKSGIQHILESLIRSQGGEGED